MSNKNKEIFFGYGIVDKNDNPYLEYGAVSLTCQELNDAVAFMNAMPNLGGNQDRVPFRVVELYLKDGC